MSGPMIGEAVNAASMAFKNALIERALGAELDHHLGYPKGTAKPEAVSNQRNGSTEKTLLTKDGPLGIDAPHDRDASFEPLLIPKHERRFTGFDEKIVAMYAHGMMVREVQGFLGTTAVNGCSVHLDNEHNVRQGQVRTRKVCKELRKYGFGRARSWWR